MKVLLSFTAKLPGFFLKFHLWLESALEKVAKLIARRDDTEDDPWEDIL